MFLTLRIEEEYEIERTLWIIGILLLDKSVSEDTNRSP
jgi:hypothetical protein